MPMGGAHDRQLGAGWFPGGKLLISKNVNSLPGMNPTSLMTSDTGINELC